jgi:hypothetical protein
MKKLVRLFTLTPTLLFICCVSASAGDDGIAIRNAVATKFSQSSKGIVNLVEENKGYVKVVASKAGIGDENEIIIDVAVALNRINNNINNWKNVSIAINNKTFLFSRKDFDMFRSGKINDQQFLRQLKTK